MQSDGIEAGLDALIAAEGAPAQVDATLRLATVTRTDLHVTYDFILNEPDAEALAHDYRRKVLSNFCDGLMRYLNLGATMSLHYTRPDGIEIETVQISLADCTT